MQPKLRIDAGSNMLSMDWCPHDPNMLLTSTENGYQSLWNTETCQRLRDYPQQVFPSCVLT